MDIYEPTIFFVKKSNVQRDVLALAQPRRSLPSFEGGEGVRESISHCCYVYPDRPLFTTYTRCQVVSKNCAEGKKKKKDKLRIKTNPATSRTREKENRISIGTECCISYLSEPLNRLYCGMHGQRVCVSEHSFEAQTQNQFVIK